MNKRLLSYCLSAVLLGFSVLVPSACSKDDDGVGDGQHLTKPITPKEEEPAEPEADDPTAPHITTTVRYESSKMTAYNFEYPSTDPYGNAVMLSGAITIGDEVKKGLRARGLMLYNHFTIFRADECPSRGELSAQKIIVGSGLITVSADYYGFGTTADQLQAYCMSRQNAQASVDALLAAKKLLPKMGYQWNDDVLFNIGYSEGGQTTMGVVRLIDEKYPDLHLTYSIAGGGSYDIPETYRQLIRAEISGMPSTVVHVLLTYDEYFHLGISRDRMFIEPVLSNIDEWFISMKHSRIQIDEELIGSLDIDKFVTPEIQDLSSELSQRILEKLDTDNLCKDWTPRQDEHILLVHHKADNTVPVQNATNLYDFLHTEKGMENVDLYMKDWGSIRGLSAHDTGAIYFMIGAVNKVCQKLGILPWFNPLNVDI